MAKLICKMKLIPLTQNKFAQVDDEDFQYLNQWKWYAVKDGNTFYPVRAKWNGSTQDRIRMYNAIMNTPNNLLIDHADGNGLNCQKNNMRFATRSQNGMNRNKQKSKTSSKYKGCSWVASRNKWQSNIQINGKLITLGRFKTEIEAAITYNMAAINHYGEFAKINSI